MEVVIYAVKGRIKVCFQSVDEINDIKLFAMRQRITRGSKYETSTKMIKK